MAQINTFKDILTWQKSHELTLLIYKITTEYPKNELFSMVSQMRRASYSIPSNIVEGFRRNNTKDSLKFYNIADASLEELKYFLYLSTDLNYINKTVYDTALSLSEEVGKLLTRWIQSQRKYL
ncbi:four helix bundle protein [Patescibacteria group bacterium]|nr:four helix bundle protein [Patescibacteria group bacterium]MBU1895622.1 four helix bundle protein [Patescibacteria group bacterium]